MLSVSNAYTTAIKARERIDRITGTITLKQGTVIPLDDSIIAQDGLQLKSTCVSGAEFEFGNVTIKQLTLSLRTATDYTIFYDAIIVLQYEIQVIDNTPRKPRKYWYKLPLGIFTVSEALTEGTQVKLTAYDNLIKLTKDYDGATLSGTPYALLSRIASICDLTLSTTLEDLSNYPNASEVVQIDTQSGCNTYRDCVKVVAQCIGAFAIADTQGQLTLKRFGKTSVDTITKAHRFSFVPADFVCQYSSLSIKSYLETFVSGSTEGLQLQIIDAPAWDYGDSNTLQSRCDNLFNELQKIAYTPSTLDMPIDPSIECGDLLDVVTDKGNVSTLVTSCTWNFRGHMTIESTGSNTSVAKSKPRVTTEERRLYTLVNRTNEKIELIAGDYVTTSTLEVTAKGIVSTVTDTIDKETERAMQAEDVLSSTITQTVDAITAEVTRATKAEGTLSSRITQNADSITTEIKRATEEEGKLSSKITQTVDAIRLSVSSHTADDETVSTISITNGTTVLNSVKVTGTTAEQAAKIAVDAVNGITLSVSNSDTGASSTITIKSGSTTISSATIEFAGLVTFSNLKDGTTEISGNNIKTGTIDASKVTVTNLQINNVKYGDYPVITCTNSYSNPTIDIGKSQIYSTWRPNVLNIHGITINLGDVGASITTINAQANYLNILAEGNFTNDYVHIGFTNKHIVIGLTTNSQLVVRPNISTSGVVYFGTSEYPWSNSYFTNLTVSTSVQLGTSTYNSKIGFFGATPITRKTIATMNTNDTLSTCISKLNTLLTTLKDYGLIAN